MAEIRSIREYGEHRERMQQSNEMLERRKPRTIAIGENVPEIGEAQNYIEGSPERAVIEFLQLINIGNYGFMFKKMHRGYTAFGSAGTQIGEIRKDFSGIKILSFRIIGIEDCALAISEVSLELNVSRQGNSMSKNCKFRMIFEDENEMTMIYGQQKGERKIISGYSQILY